VASGLQAFSYFRSPGTLKRFTMCRPVLRALATPSVQMSINVDFDQTAPTASLAYAVDSGAVWDYAPWDTSAWSLDLQIYKQWQGATGIGYAAAPYLLSSTKGDDIRWVSTDIVMEHGSIL